MISDFVIDARRGLATAISSRAARQSVLAGSIQFVTQGLRLGTNIVLASLLTPAIFGILAIVTTVRTGMELLSDLGINQSIVVSDDGDKQEFIETAWALQAWRGLVLMIVGMAISYPIALFYDIKELALLLAIGSVASLIGGFARPGPAILQRNRHVSRIMVQRVVVAVATSFFSIAFALASPTAMSLVLASILTVAFTVLVSFLILPLPGYRPRMMPRHRKSIISFGKWIFFSTAIYFFATNFDRLYLPLHVSLAIFGVYGIARSLADAVVQTASQVSQLVLLPAVARNKNSLNSNNSFRTLRFWGFAILSAGLGVLTAIADLIVTAIFDPRYWLAAVILPILLIGSWFSLIAMIVESTMLGLSRTKALVAGNAMRLVTSVVGLPIALASQSLLPVIAVVALADAPRAALLNWFAYREKVSFIRQEALFFLFTIAAALTCRWLLVKFGLTDGLISDVQWVGVKQLLEFPHMI